MSLSHQHTARAASLLTRRQAIAICAASATSVLAAGCTSGLLAGNADPRSRLGVTTVSFRERYSMRLGNRTTPGTDSYLNAPQFVRDNLGLRNLEVWNIQFEDESDDYCLRLRAAADKAGVRLTNVQLDGTYDLASDDDAVRSAGIAFVRRWIDRTRLIGAGSIRANLGPMQAVGVFPRERVIDSFKQLTAYAKSLGVKLLAENHTGHSVDIDNVVAVLRGVNDPSCRAVADWGNSKASNVEDRIAQLAKLAPWLEIVSAKAAAFAPDYSVVDYDIGALTRATESWGFSGLYSVELFTIAKPPADTLQACRSVAASIEANLRR